MTPDAEESFAGGLLVGVYRLPRPGEVTIENGWLRDVVDAVVLVARWSRAWPVDVCDVASTLRVVHGHEHPEMALLALMEEWDRNDTRARELVPYVLLVRALTDAVNQECDAQHAMRRALDRHETAKARFENLLSFLPRAA